MFSTKKRLAPCPNCRTLTEFSTENKFRPFCSERCKLIDLGLWANEEYKIATADLPDTQEPFSD